MSDVPRIPVPETAELRADVAELLPLTAAPGREPPRTMAMLARQPDLLAPFLGWAAALALHGALSKRHHELLALRAARNTGNAFEWVEHAEFARSAGLTDDEIDAVAAAGPDDPRWSAVEQALLRAADELHATSNVTDATWAVLAEALEPAALVEMVFVVGQYTMLSLLANTTGITPPEDAPPVPWA